MEKVKNLRRIPTGEVLKSKEVSFKLYLKLQHISKKNFKDNLNKHRYVPFNLVNKTYLAKELEMSRQTIITKFKGLEKSKLIKSIYTLGNDYYILPDKKKYYVLLDIDCIQLLLSNCDEYCIRIFLLHKSYTNKYGEYYLTLEQIAEQVGLSKTHLQKIIDSNSRLENLGVLQIDRRTRHENGQPRQNNRYKLLK